MGLHDASHRDAEVKWPEFESDLHYFQSVIFGNSFHSLSLNFFICNTIKIIAATSQVSMRIKQESIQEERRTIPEIKLAYKS